LLNGEPPALQLLHNRTYTTIPRLCDKGTKGGQIAYFLSLQSVSSFIYLQHSFHGMLVSVLRLAQTVQGFDVKLGRV
jgi:hypothetical protein